MLNVSSLYIKHQENLLTVYRAVIDTSKEVTAIYVTIKCSIWAKNDNGDEVIHAQAFDLVIETEAGTPHNLGRFLVSGTKQQQFFRTLKIANLPLGAYKIRLTPIRASSLTTNIHTLSENNVVSTISTGVTIGGNAISVLAELGASTPPATATSWMSFDGKPQHSDQSGPSLQVSHINEIVVPLAPPTYPGYTVAQSRIRASDRIQNAAAESWSIPRGQIVRNHLFARTIAPQETDTGLLRVTESFATVDAIPRGAVVRILGKGSVVVTGNPNPLAPPIYIVAESRSIAISTGLNSSVVAISAVDYDWAVPYMAISHPSIPSDAVIIAKLGFNQVLLGDQWGRKRVATAAGTGVTATLNPMPASEPGDDLIIYTWDSSNYFPDLFVDRLINPVSGLGNSVNGDYFIHYNSIVRSRKFCVEKQYFYDGVIADGSFEDWATSAAPSSLLYPTMLDGKYALLPQQDARPSFLFTDSNTIEFKEHDVPYQQTKTSVVLVKYQTNLGRERQVRISTAGVVAGTEAEVTRTIDTKGVTREQQATEIGCVALKSLRLQNRACDIKTDVASGLYTKQGDIVRSQHVQIEYCDENSGFLIEVEPPTNQREAVIKTIPITLFSSGYIDLAEPHHLLRLGANSLLPSDSIEISGVHPAVDGIYSNSDGVATIRILSDTRIYIVCSTVSATANGTVKIIRTQFDQVATLSEEPSVTANTRATIGHRSSRFLDTDRTVTALGGGRYRINGLETPLEPGDNYAMGESSTFDRVWRITSIKPDVLSNTVQLTGILWTPDVLSPSGLVVS
jgi:hypothetical protein